MTDLTDAIHNLAGHSALADSIGRFAAEDLVYLSLAVLAWLYFREPSLRPFLAAGLAAALAVGLAAVIGFLDYVPRPFVAEHFTPLISHPPDASFPSDHLAALGALCGACWFTARRLSIAIAFVAIAVAFARVYVGVHWVTDVVGGFGLGAVAGVLAWYLSAAARRWIDSFDQRLRRRHLRPEWLIRGNRLTRPEGRRA
ncbi:MAG: phosphatase PAP2 family protein [Candidatus Dormibacteraceae bacterium]